MADCVGCGYECRKAPCGYSLNKMEQEEKLWDTKKGCPYLSPGGIQWRCGVYLEASPALKKEMESVAGIGIGAGCSSPLFNSVREQMIQRLRSCSALPETSSAVASVPT